MMENLRNGHEEWERTAAQQNQTFEIMLDPAYCYDREAVCELP